VEEPAAVKRFYREVRAQEGADGWHVTLDGRRVRTQGGRPQVLPSARLARLLAAEWADQGETIDPRGFRMRDLADYALDVIAEDRQAAAAALLRYAETDTLCYRADPDEPLWKRQQAEWEPLLAACEAQRDHPPAAASRSAVAPAPPPRRARRLLARGLDDADFARGIARHRSRGART
jgi:chaperone required for assembly of F1-ATPase